MRAKVEVGVQRDAYLCIPDLRETTAWKPKNLKHFPKQFGIRILTCDEDMHLCDDIGDASSSLCGSTSSFRSSVQRGHPIVDLDLWVEPRLMGVQGELTLDF